MKDLLEQFDESARERVNAAVATAEQKTAAEILPVVARCSGSYDRAEDIVGLWTGVVSMGVVWLLFQGVVKDVGWSGESSIRIGFWWLVGLLVVGFVAGVVLADRVGWVRRLFVPARDMERESITTAKTVFFDRRLHRTSGGTGILIYVSLLERRVVVLVDDAVSTKLDEKALGELRDEVLSGLREGDLAGGLVAGIERAGEQLGGSLPAGEERVDEVPNEVVVLS